MRLSDTFIGIGQGEGVRAKLPRRGAGGRALASEANTGPPSNNNDDDNNVKKMVTITVQKIRNNHIFNNFRLF